MIALARRDARAGLVLASAVRGAAWVVVPAVVVAETVRSDGPRDASVNRVLEAADEVAPADEATARIAGRLLAQARSNATIDALVVADAVRRGTATILTGDANDLARLAGGYREIVVQPL